MAAAASHGCSHAFRSRVRLPANPPAGSLQKYHVISGTALRAADLKDGQELANLAGQPLKVRALCACEELSSPAPTAVPGSLSMLQADVCCRSLSCSFAAPCASLAGQLAHPSLCLLGPLQVVIKQDQLFLQDAANRLVEVGGCGCRWRPLCT